MRGNDSEIQPTSLISTFLPPPGFPLFVAAAAAPGIISVHLPSGLASRYGFGLGQGRTSATVIGRQVRYFRPSNTCR